MKALLRPRAPATPLPRPPQDKQTEVLNHIAADKPVLVTGPPQCGLTTLLLRLAKTLQTEYDLASCFISGRDLTPLSPTQCYAELAARLTEVTPQARAIAHDALSLRRALLHTLSVSTRGIILIIDDMHLAPADWCMSFLNLLRSIGHEGYLQPLWQKLGCVIGSHQEPAAAGEFLQRVELQPLQRNSQPWVVKEDTPQLVIDAVRLEVRYQGRLIPLFPQELKILLFLASQPERYFSEAAIYRGISEQPYGAELGVVNLKAPIARLRKKLPSRDLIHNRRGIGYAFRPVIPYEYIGTE
ncbi:MAG: AAA family ATPase [Firmicutes bacterium]|nr:AAA family ATPase [Bacillota bacterium]